MESVQIAKQQSATSLSSQWEELGYPPLSVHMLFNETNKHPIRVKPPSGSFPDIGQIKALAMLKSTFSEWYEAVECDFVLCTRQSPFIPLGVLATARSSVHSLMSSLGWPVPNPIIDEGIVIKNQLNAISNDYWITELEAEALGLTDLVSGKAPLIQKYPSFTFIIPAYGVHNTIKQVVESIQEAANQLDDNVSWECIVVDDANAIPIESEVPNNTRIHVIRSEERLYCGGARNLGLSSAKGEVIFFLDGDTIIQSSYIKEHLFRQLLIENLVTVSMRDYLDGSSKIEKTREPDITRDTRMSAVYSPERIGLTQVRETVKIKALEETDYFRSFGFGRKIGPVDLPFMVKGNNLVVCRQVAEIKFPPNFVGYGPEDVTFAAKAIARGCTILPVLSTGVFHINHPPRSGSTSEQNKELVANLERMSDHLSSSVWKNWCE